MSDAFKDSGTDFVIDHLFSSFPGKDLRDVLRAVVTSRGDLACVLAVRFTLVTCASFKSVNC